MNPWGTLNDWLRFDAEERVANHNRVRHLLHRPRRNTDLPDLRHLADLAGFEPAATRKTLTREDLTTSA